MRILVTGGAGFLGSNMADRLAAAGREVAVLDNYATGRRDAPSPSERIQVVDGSVVDKACVDALFDSFRPTHVLHAAAAYKDPDDWGEDVLSNVLGTVNVIRASQRHEVERFVYFQTALSYGAARQVPIPVDHPLHPLTSYSISKCGGERYLAMSGLNYVNLRLANVYGPRSYTGPMPAFYKRLKGGQPCLIVRTRRDFLEFDDFMRLMEMLLLSEAPGGDFNVSSGEDCTIEDVYRLTVKILGVTPADEPKIVDPLEDDLNSLLLDPSKVQEVFGWKPEVDLEAGMRKLIAWYEENGVGETFTHLRAAKD